MGLLTVCDEEGHGPAASNLGRFRADEDQAVANVALAIGLGRSTHTQATTLVRLHDHIVGWETRFRGAFGRGLAMKVAEVLEYPSDELSSFLIEGTMEDGRPRLGLRDR